MYFYLLMNKDFIIIIIKMALLDCPINEKCCCVDGVRVICLLFSSPPREIWQLKSPHPCVLHLRQKNADARGSAWVSPGGGDGVGGGGCLGAAGIDWCKKGVNYFPSRANYQFEKDVTDKRLVNSVKYYLSLRLVWSLFTCKEVWKQM